MSEKSNEAAKGTIRTRQSLRDLAKPENADKLNSILKAFKLVKELPTDNPNSFWSIAGLYGAPFSEKGNSVFGPRGNILFPTWNRFYLLRLENAMRTVCPKEDVALPYWDATSKDSLNEGLPSLLTQPTVQIDGKTEINPFLFYEYPEQLDVRGDIFDKFVGDKTVRYPYCQLKNVYGYFHNEEMRKRYPGDETGDVTTSSIPELNNHVISWLNQGPPGTATEYDMPNSVYKKFVECLETMTYFYFSHVEQAKEISLESPCNALHLALGGADMWYDGYYSIEGASGDIGNSDTSAFDPIFWFHRCNVDRMFWVWQKRKGYTNTLEIDAPLHKLAIPPNNFFDLDTQLIPFQGSNGLLVTSRDGINIENQLNYTYSIGSLDAENAPNRKILGSVKHNLEQGEEGTEEVQESKDEEGARVQESKDEEGAKVQESKDEEGAKVQESKDETIAIFFPNALIEIKPKQDVDPGMKSNSQRIRVTNIDKANYSGSFGIRLSHKIGDKYIKIGEESILNTWNQDNSKNSQETRYASAVFILPSDSVSQSPKVSDFKVEVVILNVETGKLTKEEIKMSTKPGEKDAPAITMYTIYESKE